MITRRDWLGTGFLGASLAIAACGRKRSPRYQGYALIANHDSRSLAVIDLSRFQRLKEIPLDTRPSWVVAVPSRSRAYVLSSDSSVMDVINLDNLLPESQVALGGKPQAVRLSDDQQSLWLVLREPDALVQFNSASGARVTRVKLPSPGADLDVRQQQIAIAFPDHRTVGRYGAGSGNLQTSAPLPAAPDLVRIRADGKVLLTGNTEDHSLTAIDAATMRPMVVLPLAVAPRHFCFNSDGGQLFVTGDGMDAVVIVSPYQTEVNATILAGHTPASMAVTTNSPQYLFVGNPQSGDVTVIRIDDRKVLARIPVGQQPGVLMVTPDNEYVLALNEQSGDVAVIRLLNIRQANLISRHSRTAPLFTLIAVGGKPVSVAICPRLT